MKVALCCIGRLENNYAVEYVEYYKKIGFDKIFIYDNNHEGEEHFEDVLQPYIDDCFVEIIDYRNKTLCQMKAYEECYNKHNKEYEWMAFFDFDEYITFKDNETIKKYLSDKIFNDFECIHLNWMYYGDNDNVRYDNRPLTERFTKPADYDLKITYNFSENNHVKSIIKGGLNKFEWLINTHSPHIGLKCCNAVGEINKDSAFSPYNFDRCYLRHFATKTIEEWVKYRMRRGNADITYEEFRKAVNADRFFLVNERTKEKEDLMNQLLIEIDKPRYYTENLDFFIGTHKSFTPPVKNKAYKVIVGNHDVSINGDLDVIKCGDKNDLLDDMFYSEIYMFKKLIGMNYPFKDYVGFCHYRKYFSFMDEIPDLDKAFKIFDTIVGKPIISRIPVRKSYGACHNIEDLEIVEKIINDKYPHYIKPCNAVLNKNIFIPYNMFIMKRDDFKRYVEFVWGVLDEYLNIVGRNIFKRIVDNKEKYLKKTAPNNTIEYQYRIGGYLAERLTNIFFVGNFKKMKTYPIVVTEKKYPNEKRAEIKKKIIEEIEKKKEQAI